MDRDRLYSQIFSSLPAADRRAALTTYDVVSVLAETCFEIKPPYSRQIVLNDFFRYAMIDKLDKAMLPEAVYQSVRKF